VVVSVDDSEDAPEYIAAFPVWKEKTAFNDSIFEAEDSIFGLGN
jgi:hypothetical protein